MAIDYESDRQTTEDDIASPPERGDERPQRPRTAVVTGAAGLGFEAALILAGAGARVVLAGRDEYKGASALAKIRARFPKADARFLWLDLAALDSIPAFVKEFAAGFNELDILINAAGIMLHPARETTVDGFERHFAVNYLSHFALTGRLLEFLRRGYDPRVVNVTGPAFPFAAIDFEDLQGGQNYKALKASTQSLLAKRLFAVELGRRSARKGWGIKSYAAHPGFARTELFSNGRKAGFSATRTVAQVLQPFLSHAPEVAVLPIVRAATVPGADPHALYAPSGFLGLKGPPVPVEMASVARDPRTAARLWDVSQMLARHPFPS
jgi:NAD(P)-dependent dehydrogenase (short-subunit alcohol dehydrogenase family)